MTDTFKFVKFIRDNFADKYREGIAEGKSIEHIATEIIIDLDECLGNANVELGQVTQELNRICELEERRNVKG